MRFFRRRCRRTSCGTMAATPPIPFSASSYAAPSCLTKTGTPSGVLDSASQRPAERLATSGQVGLLALPVSMRRRRRREHDPLGTERRRARLRNLAALRRVWSLGLDPHGNAAAVEFRACLAALLVERRSYLRSERPMAQRLNRPLTMLATFSGPITIGRFDDGTICVAGPNDPPILIRDGSVMRLDPSAKGEVEGDMVFAHERILSHT